MRKLIVLLGMSVLVMYMQAQPNPLTAAYLRFAHFTPRVETFAIYLDGEDTRERLALADVSAWVPLEPDNYTIVFAADGDDAEDGERIRVALEAGERVTIAALSTGELTAIEEDFSELPEGEARLTLVQTIENAPELSLSLDGDVFVRELVYDTPVIVDVVANTYLVELSAEDPDDLYLDLQQVTLEPDQNYLIAVYNSIRSPQFVTVPSSVGDAPDAEEAVESEDAEAVDNALIRIAHLSSGTPPVDLYINGELTDLSEVAFSELTRWRTLTNEPHTIAVTLANEPITEAIVPPFEVTFGDERVKTIAVVGSLANNTFEAQVLDENFTELDDDLLRISVFNANAEVGPIDVQVVEGDEVTPLVERLGYPGFFGSNDGFIDTLLEAGTYNLQIVTTEDGTVLADLGETTLIDERNYFIAVIVADPPFILTFRDIEEVEELLNTPIEEA